MATFKSIQEANKVAVPPVLNQPRDYQGRVRVSSFEYLAPASSPPQIADIIVWCTVPAGAKILAGQMSTDASAGTSINVGTPAAATRYKAATSINAAGTFPFAQLIAENVNDVLAADTLIQSVVSAAAIAISTNYKGWVKWVLD